MFFFVEENKEMNRNFKTEPSSYQLEAIQEEIMEDKRSNIPAII